MVSQDADVTAELLEKGISSTVPNLQFRVV
jgi:hypothetical protein